MALAAILAAKAEVVLSIRIGSQHADRGHGSVLGLLLQIFVCFFLIFLDSVGNPLFIEIDKCVSVGDF